MAFFEGYAVGLALIVLIGPVLFVLLKSTLERGAPQGLSVAFGIFVSDIIAVVLCAFGVVQFLQQPQVLPFFVYGGGLLLLVLGSRYILAPAIHTDSKDYQTGTSLLGFFAKGFLVNFVNPFVFMVWIGITGAATVRYGFGWELAWFLTGVLLGIFTLDVTKVFLAQRIKPLLKPRWLKICFRVSGFALVAFALRLFFLGYTGEVGF